MQTKLKIDATIMEVPTLPEDFDFDEGLGLDVEHDMWETLQEDNQDHSELSPQQLEEYGANSPSWLAFLEGLKSRDTYEKRLYDFLLFHSANPQNDMTTNLINYFQVSHAKKDEEGDLYHAPTSLRSWFSVFLKFYLHSGRGDLKKDAPIIATKLNQWEKEYEQIKAKTFTKQDLLPLFTAPNDTTILQWKVYAALALGCAGRTCEMDRMTWEHSISPTRDDKGDYFTVRLYRAKNSGPKVLMTFHIRGELEMQAIKDYITCFDGKPSLKKGKLFKQLIQKASKVVGTGRNVGRNTLGDYGKCIAKWLDKPDFEAYTGHCFRRTSTTFAADEGLTISQMKALTGHKSDKVVQGYVDTSKVQLDKANEAVTIGATSSGEKRGYQDIDDEGPLAPRTKPKVQSSSSSSSFQHPPPPATNLQLNFTGAVINAPIYLDLKSLVQSTKPTGEQEQEADEKENL